MIDYNSCTVKIGEIKDLILDYDIEVESPDGWVKITNFVDKGMFQEYILETQSGKIVRCNENHLFETRMGWATAKECEVFGPIDYLTENGYETGIVYSTDNVIPIVDISVDHENRRYYSNGVSSHNSGGGKSAVKCSIAADMLRNGVDVLYITLELAEERIAERIDANLLNIPIGELKTMPEKMFKSKIDSLKTKTTGKLVIKEYPTRAATVDNFNALLEELKAKKGFIPSVVIVDYLQIVASSSVRGGNVNTYQEQKSVAEELRGFAVKHNLALLTSVQTNRSGYNVSDMDEASISDSIAIVFTADLIVGIIRPDDLKEQNQVLFKQIKNRFGDPSQFQKFLCGMDTSRMKVYDLENGTEQANRFKSRKEKDREAEPTPEAPTKKVVATVDALQDWDFD